MPMTSSMPRPIRDHINARLSRASLAVDAWEAGAGFSDGTFHLAGNWQQFGCIIHC
jgi:hypothetical protein